MGAINIGPMTQGTFLVDLGDLQLPEHVRRNIDSGIRSVVLGEIAKVDLGGDIRISPLAPATREFGPTMGMMVERGSRSAATMPATRGAPALGKKVVVETTLEGGNFGELDGDALNRLFASVVIPKILDALAQAPRTARDWSASASGNANSSGSWEVGGRVEYNWKAYPGSRDGSAWVGGSGGSGGWSVGGGVTIHF